MPERITCFLIEKAGRDARWLRRYSSGHPDGAPYTCEGGWHNMAVRIEDAPAANCHPTDAHRGDGRWPAACQRCGKPFRPEDHWQLFPLTLYRAPDGREYVLHETPPPGVVTAPPGAVWLSSWCPGPKKHEGPYLWVMTPGGAWCVDGNSTNGPGWTRSGTPPLVTARPSILIPGKYHGFLTDGVLEPCGDSPR